MVLGRPHADSLLLHDGWSLQPTALRVCRFIGVERDVLRVGRPAHHGHCCRQRGGPTRRRAARGTRLGERSHRHRVGRGCGRWYFRCRGTRALRGLTGGGLAANHRRAHLVLRGA
ncbi:Hypothetical protein A7982_08285 [Minicystis rosea]|nr:Hypothetical protein A7982_08285 [Minicystis rosea]